MKFKLTTSDETNRGRAPEDKVPVGQTIIWDENGHFIATCAPNKGEFVLAALRAYKGAKVL